MKAQTGSRDLALVFLYPRERERVTILQEVGWAPEPLKGCGISRPNQN
jgi:hypothetical protein